MDAKNHSICAGKRVDRDELLGVLREKRVATGSTMKELRDSLGFGAYSIRQFKLAVGSLVKSRKVTSVRPPVQRREDALDRPIHLVVNFPER